MAGTQRPRTRKAIQEDLPAWGVTLFESHHTPDFQMEWRTHPFLKLTYVLTGQGQLLLKSGEHPFQAGNLLIVPPGTPNRLVDDDGAPSSLYVLCIASPLLNFDPGIMSQLTAGSFALPSHVRKKVAIRFQRLLFQLSDARPATPLVIVAQALDLLAIASSIPMAPVARDRNRPQDTLIPNQDIQAYLRFLDEHFSEARSIDEAAELLGMSRRAFTTAFRLAVGTSWLDYVNQLKIRHACHLLQRQAGSVNSFPSVAFACGFADLSTFYRQFKRQMGVPPSKYLERLTPQRLTPPTASDR